jgi:hypothetical protein
MLTALLVTSPAHSKAIPKASTIGHAVGAGSSMVPGKGCDVWVPEPIFYSLFLYSLSIILVRIAIFNVR